MTLKTLRRAIDLAWIILVVCFVIKVLGGNWFAIDNTSKWLEEHLWVYIILCTMTSYILFNLYYLAICEVPYLKWWIHVALVPYFVAVTVIKAFIPTDFYLLIDLVSAFIVPALLIFKELGKPKKAHFKKYFRIVIAFALNCGFQAISTMVRDVAIKVVVTDFFSTLILTLDVFVMLTLYWLYTLKHKKEVEDMGMAFMFLLGKGKEELEQLLKEAQEKLAKDPGNPELEEEVSVIEKALEEK